MFVRAETLPKDKSLEADLLIIGCGPAGLLIASALMDRGLRIVMLESGGLEFSRDVQMLHRAEIAGAPNHPGTHSRYRVYGGSTTRWGGQCVPLEPIDFEERPGIADSGWPFDYAHLAPWYDRAAKTLGLRPEGFNVPAWEATAGSLPELASNDIDVSAIAFAEPLDIGAALRERLSASTNVTVVLGANAQEVETNDAMTRVTGVRYATLDGVIRTATGQQIVLACGGIENARLLLASRDRSEAGIGNLNGVVGRYFMDHPYLMPAWLDADGGHGNSGWHIIETFEDAAATPGAHAAYALTQSVRRAENLPACVGYFMRRQAWQLQHSYMAKGGAALTHFAEIARGDRVRDNDLALKARDLLVDAPSTLATLGGWARAFFRPEPRAALRICLEATPNVDSRITLSAQKDRLGEPLARVDWKMNPGDWVGLERFRKSFAAAVAASGIGQLVDDPATDEHGYPLSMVGGRHHMGATRMHHDPKRGVVDQDLRVHGMENLFIAGSSVFPTGGWANPTFTLIALALRLADNLRGRT